MLIGQFEGALLPNGNGDRRREQSVVEKPIHTRVDFEEALGERKRVRCSKLEDGCLDVWRVRGTSRIPSVIRDPRPIDRPVQLEDTQLFIHDIVAEVSDASPGDRGNGSLQHRVVVESHKTDAVARRFLP